MQARRTSIRFLTAAILTSAVPAVAATSLVGVTAQAAEPSAKSGTTVGLLCTWVAFESETESFVVDLAQRAIYWVNQNQMMKVRQFNAGRLVAEGVRSRLKVGAGDYREKVAVRAIFDRVSGEFLLLQDAYALQGTGSCQKRYTF